MQIRRSFFRSTTPKRRGLDNNRGAPIRLLVALLVILCVLNAAPSIADMYGEEYQSCSRGSTIDIIECLGAHAKAWESKLNAEFNLVASRADPRKRDSLRAGQGHWIRYRDENCRFYALGKGSISQIEAAECLRWMTEARAGELELLGTGAGSH